MPRIRATHGPFAMPDYYFEFRRAQAAALEAAADVVAEVADDFARLTGRINHAVEPYRLDDAESVLVALGSTAGTVKDVVDELRDDGERGRPAEDPLVPSVPGERLARVARWTARGDRPRPRRLARRRASARRRSGIRPRRAATRRCAATSMGSAGATSIRKRSGRSSTARRRGTSASRGEPCPV